MSFLGSSPGVAIKSGCNFSSLYDDLISILDEFGLVHMINESTRSENVIDLFITS